MKLGIAEKTGILAVLLVIVTGLVTSGVYYYGIGDYLIDNELVSWGYLILAMILVFFTSLIAYFLTRHQLKGLAVVIQATKDFAQGKHTLNLPVSRKDEIGTLAKAFDHMANQYLAHEAALVLSEERFQLVVSGADKGIWDWNILTNEVYYSSRFKELLGYPDEEFPHQLASLENKLHPQDAAATLETTRAHLEDHLPYDIEFRLFTRLGEYRWFHARAQAIWDDANRPLRMVGSITDITLRKEAEQKNIVYQNHLEEMVSERTHALIQARDDALVAERAMSIFLTNMSHELRTPLNGIISFSNFGLKKIGRISEDKLRHYLTEIQSSGYHLLHLVNDLLDLSKLRAGKMIYHYTPLSPNKIINHVIGEFTTMMDERNISIVFNEERQHQTIEIDEVKFAQVIRNLLSNALKFSSPETVVDISANYVEESSYYEILVANEGVGIPAGEEEKIFQAFSQSSLNQASGSGTGLGLPICKEIIESGHNGLIKAESRENGQTCFVVQIPVVQTRLTSVG